MDKARLPYVRLGGRAPIARMVERFYALMDSDPAFAALRAMHATDLAPMTESLTDFLVAWTGGPRDWFAKHPGVCIMSAHAALPGIDRATAAQWIACMTRAAEEIRTIDPEFAASMLDSMAAMCGAMAARADLQQAG